MYRLYNIVSYTETSDERLGYVFVLISTNIILKCTLTLKIVK